MNNDTNNTRPKTSYLVQLWSLLAKELGKWAHNERKLSRRIEELEQALAAKDIEVENLTQAYVSLHPPTPRISHADLIIQTTPPRPVVAPTALYTFESRPGTSDSTTQARAGFTQQLGAAQHGDTFDNIAKITQAHAQKIIEDEPCTRNEIQCMLSTKASGHSNGYIRINLRNTRSRINGAGLINCSPYLHQVAVIAKGRLNTLRAAGQAGGHQVSHLCHNEACFNPEHVIVESAALNKARASCQGQKIVRFYHLDDGQNVRRDSRRNEISTQYHPCRHGVNENRVLCILPTREVRTPEPFFLVNGQGPMV
jgi:hypothetical protein